MKESDRGVMLSKTEPNTGQATAHLVSFWNDCQLDLRSSETLFCCSSQTGAESPMPEFTTTQTPRIFVTNPEIWAAVVMTPGVFCDRIV